MPDYGGACITNVVPALLEPAAGPAAGVAARRPRRARPGRAARARRPRAGTSSRTGGTWRPTLAAMAGGPITHGRARRPRPPPSPRSPPAARRASTASSATASTCGGEVLNVLRWPTPAGDARRRIPPAEVQARARRSAGQRPPVVTRAEFAGTGLHRRPPRRRPLPRLAACRRRSSTEVRRAARRRRAVRLRLLRRHRQGRPRVRPRRALRRRAGRRRPAGRRPARRAARRARRWWSPPTTARSTWATRIVPPRTTTCSSPGRAASRARAGSAGCTPGPARPATLARRRPGAPRRPGLGASRRERGHRRGLVRAPVVADAAAARLGDVALVAQRRRGLRRPRRHRPVSRSVGRHGSLTPAEMLVPLLAGAALTAPWPERDRRRPTTPMPAVEPRRARLSVRRRGRAAGGRSRASRARESVEQPAKVMRIGSMIKQLLDEVRAAPPRRGQPRAACAEIYETSVRELADGLSPDLRDELARLGPAVRRATTPERGRAADRPGPAGRAGSRACSTASRPRCSPSRWRPASSSSRCSASGASARPGRPTAPGSRERPHARAPTSEHPDARRGRLEPGRPSADARNHSV